MFAQDAVYHHSCLNKLYTRDRAKHRQLKREQQDSQEVLEGIALAELVAYVKDSENEPNVFFM